MSKRVRVYEIIDNVCLPHEADFLKEYISNLHKKNSQLEESIQVKKKKRGKRKKSLAKW